jgi:hypothetical protein
MTMTVIEQTDSPTIATGLTAIDLAALRKADSVCFFHRKVPDASGETSYIDAIKRAKVCARDPFARDVSHVIACPYRLREYTSGDDKIPYNSEEWSGFESISSAQWSEEWKTVVSLLRVGDRLTLHWQRGAWTTESMANASPKFYGDSLSIIVERAKATLEFHVRMSVCENNSARMVRRG